VHGLDVTPQESFDIFYNVPRFLLVYARRQTCVEYYQQNQFTLVPLFDLTGLQWMTGPVYSRTTRQTSSARVGLNRPSGPGQPVGVGVGGAASASRCR
jgi:hypothetical protein